MIPRKIKRKRELRSMGKNICEKTAKMQKMKNREERV